MVLVIVVLFYLPCQLIVVVGVDLLQRVTELVEIEVQWIPYELAATADINLVKIQIHHHRPHLHCYHHHRLSLKHRVPHMSSTQT